MILKIIKSKHVGEPSGETPPIHDSTRFIECNSLEFSKKEPDNEQVITFRLDEETESEREIEVPIIDPEQSIYLIDNNGQTINRLL